MKAIIFDVFGTLVRIAEPRRPFRQLLELAGQAGQPIARADAARAVMTQAWSLADAARGFGLDLDPQVLAALEADLAAELQSIELYPEVARTLIDLHAAGVPLAVCSNLAAPYGPPVEALLPVPIAVHGWSYAVGAIKPDPAIYHCVLQALGCEAGQVLMIGDTPEADRDAPRSLGLQARLLDRDRRTDDGGALPALDTLLDSLGLR